MLFSALKPMIVSVGKDAFDDERFIFEPKWDGWRMLIHKQGDRIEAYTRNGNIVTGKFPELREACTSIRASTAILDCEGVCMRDGRSVFDDFSYRGRLSVPSAIAAARRTHPATFVVFDLLLSDKEHLDEPLMTRKARLQEIVAATDLILPTAYIEKDGAALRSWSMEHNMEGIVAKRKDSTYALGVESKDWMKMNNVKTIDTIILGYRLKPYFGLVIGLHFRTIKYKRVGVVEFGFNADEKQAFLEIARKLVTRSDADTHWIQPRLCCRIDYLERTDQHQLRTTVFRGFLFHKDPDECYWTY